MIVDIPVPPSWEPNELNVREWLDEATAGRPHFVPAQKISKPQMRRLKWDWNQSSKPVYKFGVFASLLMLSLSGVNCIAALSDPVLWITAGIFGSGGAFMMARYAGPLLHGGIRDARTLNADIGHIKRYPLNGRLFARLRQFDKATWQRIIDEIKSGSKLGQDLNAIFETYCAKALGITDVLFINDFVHDDDGILTIVPGLSDENREQLDELWMTAATEARIQIQDILQVQDDKARQQELDDLAVAEAERLTAEDRAKLDRDFNNKVVNLKAEAVIDSFI